VYIVDSQVHIWGANTPERPWPLPHPRHHRQVPSFSKDDLLAEMNAAGVDRAVIVPPFFEGERNDLALEAAKVYPDRFAVMGLFDTEQPDARERLTAWRQQQGMLGFRFSARDPKYLRAIPEGRLEWLWALAEKLGVPVMIGVLPHDLHLVDGIAERHPGLKITLDHMARVFGKKDDEAFPELHLLLALAKRPNVAVKASGLPSYTSGPYPFERMHPYLRRTFDAYGPKRLFWGTDLTKLPCSYRQAVTMFTEELPWLGNEDKEWIMGRGLCEWIGWKIP
jgi:L-fuconolactonase